MNQSMNQPVNDKVVKIFNYLKLLVIILTIHLWLTVNYSQLSK